MLFLLKKSFGDKRSLLQLKNIYASFIFRIIGLGCSLIIIPLLLTQLKNEEYGIFVTIISITSWLTFLDLGLGNGLKNKLSEALAEQDSVKARTLISTAYIAMSALVALILVAFVLIFPFIPFAKLILGAHASNASVDGLVKWALCLFCLRMTGDLINAVLLAGQRAAHAAALQMFIQLITLAAFIYLKYVLESKQLLQYGIAYFVIPLFVLVAAHLHLFKGSSSSLTPSLKYFSKHILSDLFLIGFQFLIIQIAVLIVFATDNLIIGRILGYQHVTSYNIAFRYFSVLTFGWMIILTPLWTAFSEAYIKQDFLWLKKTIHRLEKLWLLFVLCAVLMFICSKWIYKLWLNEAVYIPNILSLAMMAFILVNALTNVYVFFLNGISKIKWQVYLSVFAAAVNIPLSILLAKNLGLGNTGVIVGSTLSILPSLFYSRHLTYQLIKSV